MTKTADVVYDVDIMAATIEGKFCFYGGQISMEDQINHVVGKLLMQSAFMHCDDCVIRHGCLGWSMKIFMSEKEKYNKREGIMDGKLLLNENEYTIETCCEGEGRHFCGKLLLPDPHPE